MGHLGTSKASAKSSAPVSTLQRPAALSHPLRHRVQAVTSIQTAAE
jgi:hypothetical protein